MLEVILRRFVGLTAILIRLKTNPITDLNARIKLGRTPSYMGITPIFFCDVYTSNYDFGERANDKYLWRNFTENDETDSVCV